MNRENFIETECVLMKQVKDLGASAWVIADLWRLNELLKEQKGMWL